MTAITFNICDINLAKTVFIERILGITWHRFLYPYDYINHRLYSTAFEPAVIKFRICFVRTFGSKLYLSVEHNAVKYRRNKINVLIMLVITFSQGNDLSVPFK